MNGDSLLIYVVYGLITRMPSSWMYIKPEDCPVSHMAYNIKRQPIGTM